MKRENTSSRASEHENYKRKQLVKGLESRGESVCFITSPKMTLYADYGKIG